MPNQCQKQYQKQCQRYSKQKQCQRYDTQRYKRTQMNFNEVRGTQRNSEERPNNNRFVRRNFIDKCSDDRNRRDNIPNHKGAILESFKMISEFQESKGLRLMSITVKITLLFIMLFTILNILFSSLSFVELSLTTLFFASLCGLKLIVLVVQKYFVNVSSKTLVESLQNDCDALERVVKSSVFVQPNKESHLLQECRSRYAIFITCKYVDHNQPRVVSRDRESSRVPVKKLARVFQKNKKIRKRVRKYLLKNVPMSSRIHCFANKCNFHHEGVKYPKCYHRRFNRDAACRLPRRRKLLGSRKSLLSFIKKTLNAKHIYSPLLTNPRSRRCACCGLSRVYKSLHHRINHKKFTLSRDVEKNPGPHTVIDPNKTISAPYS